MYSQHSSSNDVYHSHPQQHDSEEPPLQPYRYHHSSSPSDSPTDFQQSANNHDHNQSHGSTESTDLIGRAVQFSTGQFAGQTIRMELQEIQKADLGRKSV